MSQPRADAASGVFAGLIVLFLIGVFIGLPVILWWILIAAFVGLFVATAERRTAERRARASTPAPRRPWDKD